MSDDFIGRGWSYPLGTSASGGIALVSKDDELIQAMHLIIGTSVGERPMRPEFGCRIHDYVFAEYNPAIAGEMIRAVEEALVRFEPRIVLISVNIVPDESNPGLLYIDVAYRPRTENDPRNLVFPFYTIPGGEE